MTHLVTGATGFIGTYTVAQLLREGHDVVALDRNLDWAVPLPDGPGSLTLIEGDVVDFSLIADLVSTHRPDAIIHLAAELHDRSAAQRGQCIQSNVVGTYNVLETARLFGTPRTVLASSAALFNPLEYSGDEPLAEDAHTFAGDVYEASKIFGESTGEYYGRKLGVVNTSIRIGLAYGAACLIGTARRMIDELVTKPLAGQAGHLEWGGQSKMNFVYIDDAADAFVRASRGPEPTSHVYHVRGDYRALDDLVEITKGLIPGAQITTAEGKARWPQSFDDSRFRRDYGYECHWSAEAAMAQIVAEKKAAFA